ncbi:MAG: amino acid adenylation domain-containing protein [Planctomycetes bacterium]|nr:amino acid adenylation domain-containing protein [Planctomycetota bacterium]
MTLIIDSGHPTGCENLCDMEVVSLTTDDHVESTLLHHLFERQVDLTPLRPAVNCGTETLTYLELDQAANRLAHLLRELEVGPETCIGFWLPRSLQVYVTLLGILKSGGAYVPLDAEYPAERVGYILQDCGIQIVITTRDYADKLIGFPGRVILIVEDWPQIASRPVTRVLPSDVQRPGSLCYVIYTSGSTGKPKGVQLEHRNVVHLVRTEAARFCIQPDDRVYQGFSIAFDASVEELWLAWCAGATLVAATPDMVHAGPDLPRLLTAAGVTVLSCVPTLLAMMEGDLETVRILIVGGEACSSDLVTRWCRPGRRMFNTYGPTEATVIATWTECDPARPVTIGEPLPGYTACVMDDQGRILEAGATGELLLGGAGLARGYVGRDDLNRERFIEVRLAGNDGPPTRLYRTGDLARWTEDRQLEFLGRIDGQVKLRGFRVELAEIDAVLLQCPGVLAAAAAVREDVPGLQQLIGYLVPRHGISIDDDAIRAVLRQRLPVYMVPVLFEVIESLPTLTSGKVDRKQLPAPRRSVTLQHDPSALKWVPRDSIEETLAATWNEVFAPAIVGPRDDFFVDLGGHSLLAARMVSALRSQERFQGVSMLDVYQQPTIETLAAVLRERLTAAEVTGSSPPPTPERAIHKVSTLQHFLSGTVQLFALYFVIGFFSLQWLAPYLTYTFMMDDEYPMVEAASCALGSLVLLYPVMLFLSIAVKWLVLGRVRPGRYPVWGTYFLRWWFVEAFRSIVPTNYLIGTPLLNWYYRLMGARIGANVYLGNDGGAMFDTLSIGDDSCLGADSHFTGATVADGWLVIGSVEIGQRCFVGTRALLGPGSCMGDDATLEDLSLLPRGGSIPPGERWHGSPACRADGDSQASLPVRPVRPTVARRFAYGVMFAIGVFVFPLLPMAAFFPGMVAMAHWNYHDEYYGYLIYSPLVAFSFVVLISLEIVVVKWLVLGRVRPGSYPLYHSFYFRKWFVDRTLDLSLDVIGPLYSTLYLAPWYRLLGARIGRRAEISTASFVSPDCLQISTESFVADAASLGAARVQNGVMRIDDIVIGKRTFIGNSSLIPVGATIPDNCLVGCLSLPPADEMPTNSSWLGSPSFFLPHRQTSDAFTEQETFRPSRWLVAQRLFIEFFRITLPSTFFIIVTNVLLAEVLVMYGEIDTWQIVAIFPVMYFLAGLSAALGMVGVKWMLMGRYRPCERPLWSRFVWRTEVVTALLDNFAAPFFLDLLAGTPFICWFFRLLGAKIGRRVYLDTTELTEFDLVHVGDDVAINHDCTLQTHLFEDRVMKMSTVKLSDGCHLGSMSLVLYDTKLEAGSSVDDLSLVMKGETLPPNTHWSGIPSRRIDSP